MVGVASALFLVADLLSPGPLAKAHEKLEGLKNCTQCHEAGQQVSGRKCLDCHKELQPEIASGTGFHGRIPPGKRDCNACHHEHQGRDFELIEWPARGKKSFDHAATGFALEGRHAALDCAKCHEKPGTFLGLEKKTTCLSCHKDEHRGQLGQNCVACHTESAWKPAPGFIHAKTDFPLRGAHVKVDCAKCHAREESAFTRFKPVAHASCTDCHKDPHEGRFGIDCTRCHVEDSWKQIKGASGERAFHDKTRYPLRGAHATVACKDCHGPGQAHKKAVYKGLAFDRCTSCHADAHEGQLAQNACDRCHDENGFRPARFEVADHAKTKYPLQGAHMAVACLLCHKQGKAVKGLVAFHPNAARCESCHADPHAGQFAKKACADCHEVATFHRPKFDHDRDSRFALTGAHRNAQCASCHVNGRYKPVDTACAACHADVHAGQFGVPADCTRCHETASFRQVKFVHAPPFTSFALAGRHAPVACDKCHAAAALAGGRTARRYKGSPVACEACHADYHRGAFGAKCAPCHTPDAWGKVAFDHLARTGWPLEGRHADTACSNCHIGLDLKSKLPKRCAACHEDVHAGEFGARCEGCHDARGWQSRFDANAHRNTGFPLSGRHAFIPCEECHLDTRDRSFSRASVSCAQCHEGDYARTASTAINHAAAGFSKQCTDCHGALAFRPARFPSHDQCFELSGGPHAGIRCLDCHRTLVGSLGIRACDTSNLGCTTCHTHSQARTDPIHTGIIGYQYTDLKCYQCHQFTPAAAAPRRLRR
ncbi:MAG TPA: hypothetical protein VLW85_23180 [Myxococcales bacterium]|nr:hypothetical protein [Myxococcales bacterium]